MKHLYLLYAPLILFASCSRELSRSEAFKLLEKEYPKELFYPVFTADPDHARKMEQAGLVTAGLVTIDTQEPFIYFTNKANNLLLPTPDFDKDTRKIQRVKTGEYHLVKITGIKGDDKKATVEYTFEVRNLTTFARLHSCQSEKIYLEIGSSVFFTNSSEDSCQFLSKGSNQYHSDGE